MATLPGGPPICVCAAAGRAATDGAATCAADELGCRDDPGIVETLMGTVMGTSTVPARAGPEIATQRSDSDRPSGPDSAGGIPPGPPPPADDDVACVRRAFRCAEWAEAGECSNNPGFMNTVCYQDCHACSPTAADQAWMNRLVDIWKDHDAAGPKFTPDDVEVTALALGVCADRDIRCAHWRGLGECDAPFSERMLHFCPRSCGTCPDFDGDGGGRDCVDAYDDSSEDRSFDQCAVWALSGECYNNPHFMIEECTRSCTACGGSDPPPGAPACVDTADGVREGFSCEARAAAGDCDTDTAVMLAMCPSACTGCVAAVPAADARRDWWADGCDDAAENCADVVANGFCDTETGPRDCAASCSECAIGVVAGLEHRLPDPVAAGPAAVPAAGVRYRCTASLPNCVHMADLGDCQSNRIYMLKHCAEACSSCVPDAAEMRARRQQRFNRPPSVVAKEERCRIDPGEVRLTPGIVGQVFERIASDPGINARHGVTILSTDPWVATLDDFVTEPEIEGLLSTVDGLYVTSNVSTIFGEADDDAPWRFETRTSQGSWCDPGVSMACFRSEHRRSIEARIADIVKASPAHLEFMQVLKYDPGQFYVQHHDYITEQATLPCGSRVFTAFLYFNDVDEGGETEFNLLNITVHPRRGRLLLWPNVLDARPDLVDRRTDHEARPVLAGQKHAVNSWVHLGPYRKYHGRGCTD